MSNRRKNYSTNKKTRKRQSTSDAISSNFSNSASSQIVEEEQTFHRKRLPRVASTNSAKRPMKHQKEELLVRTLASSNSKASADILRCELCNITCMCSNNYKAHLDGIKHRKAMKLDRKLRKTFSSSFQQNSISQVSINRFPFRIDDDADQSISSRHLLKNTIRSKGEEYIETSYDQTNTPIFYYCTLCDCTFGDRKGKDIHLKGKRHRLFHKVNLTKKEEFHQSEMDDDTKYLLMLHERIIPSSDLLNLIEGFVSAVESVLKSCSKQLQRSSNDTSSAYPFPLIGVSRVGLLGKNLIIKSDRVFHLVVLCTDWPRKKVFQRIGEILFENFDNQWKDNIRIQSHSNTEIIELETNTEEGKMSILIRFTSLEIKEQERFDSEECLLKMNCLNALDLIHSTQWFQHEVNTREYAAVLVRCLRYKTTMSRKWKALSSEAIAILVDYALSQSLSVTHAFRRVLECLSGGLILSNGSSLSIPWQTDSIKDVFEDLTDQEKNDITQEAQCGLRSLTFGYLARWFEQSTISRLIVTVPRRSYSSDSDDQISVKRQCVEVE